MGQRRDTESADVTKDNAGSPETPWDPDETPLQWLYRTRSRAKLVGYAVTAVGQNDIRYLNKSELSEQVDLSRNTVHEHITDLAMLGIYETHGGDNSFVKYRPNADSEVIRVLRDANEKIAISGSSI